MDSHAVAAAEPSASPAVRELLQRAADEQDQDLLYAGTLEFASEPGSIYGVRVISISVNPGNDELVAVTQSAYGCELYSQNVCYAHVEVFAPGALTDPDVYSLAPVEIAGKTYRQRGLFVFHSASGEARILLSRIEGVADQGPEYFLTLFPGELVP